MRSKTLIIILSLLLFPAIIGRAQNDVDTLLHMINTHEKRDTTLLLIWATLAKEYNKVDIDKSLSASDTVIKMSKALTLPGWEANAYNAKGAVYYYKGDYKGALQSFQKALVLAEQIGNKRRIWQATGNIAAIHVAMGNYAKALENYQKQVDIAAQTDKKDGIADGYNNMGAVYAEMTNYPLALEYTLKGLRISEEGKDTESLLSGYKTLANIYTALDDYDKAVDYSRRSLKIDEEMGNQRLKQQDLNNLALSFESVEDYQQAIKYRKESLEIAEEMGFEMEVMNMLVALAFDHAKISDFSNALDYCLKSQKLNEKFGDTVTMGSRLINLGYVISNAPPVLLVNKGFDSSLRYTQSVQYLLAGLKIAKEKGKLDLQRKAWEYIHPIYKNQKNFPKALEAYENLVILRDSILNNRKKKEFMRMDIQYTYDKKEDSLKLQQQVLDEKLKRQLLLSQQQEQQLELNKKELVLSGKEKELQKLAYLKTEADLQNEQLEKKGKEKQLTIAEKEKQLQLAKVKSLTNENNLNAIKQQQQRLYIFGGFILLGCTGFYFFNRTRLQQERLKTQLASERTEQQHKEAEFQRSLADVSLTALRSQMNPHFIFNCLNSIKLYTTQNNTVAASEYLTKFSRLIRLVLENSRKDTITLASELDALRLYMEMEAMRFKEKLTYNISVQRDVDLDFIEIPPLLLQPYAENAIWHGLMHKETGGRIDIDVSTAENGTMLRINIADNGIGRAKSAELMSKTATKHKSYGMKVTSERLALINSVYKTGANVTIHDLFNVDGQASGTSVIIQIPLK